MEMVVHLHPEVFDIVLNKDKDVEARVNDEKRRRLHVGDTLVFLKRPDDKEDYINLMKQFYNDEEVNKYGVVAIEFKLER